jgi:hypothetical protein
MPHKSKPHKKKSIIKSTLELKSSIKDVFSEECASISFRHLDISQGSTIDEWSQQGLFNQTIEKFKTICLKPLEAQKGENFHVYNTFPSNSKYTHPKFVPEDAIWARFHLTGINVVAGHIYKSIFYVVFFDNQHGFWEINKQKK